MAHKLLYNLAPVLCCHLIFCRFQHSLDTQTVPNYLQFPEQGLISLAFRPRLGSQVGHLWPPEHTRQYLETSRLSGLRGCYWHVDSTVSATKNSSAPNVKVSRIQKPCPAPFLLLCGRNCSLFTVSILHFHFLLITKPPKFSWAAFSSFPCKGRPVCS